MDSEPDPRRRDPRLPARDDDAAPGLPAIDGNETDTALETDIDLDVRDDDASALDDVASGDLDGTFDDELEGESSAIGEDDENAPLEADPSLAIGEQERWTEGSDASEDTPWQEALIVEPAGSAIDRGEEGFDDHATFSEDALPGLPAAHTGDTDDEDAGELDVSEADDFETPSHETDGASTLSRTELVTRWHGPPREAARAIAASSDGVIAAARQVWLFDGAAHVLPWSIDAEVSALLVLGTSILVGTDAGELWSCTLEGQVSPRSRPGTDDTSLGPLELAAIGDWIVARTRGGALFRAQGDAWTGPIVAKNVRRIRRAPGSDWLVAIVGSGTAPELLATRDARTFERLRAPLDEIVVDASRSGDVVALATTSGRLFVSRDAGASYEPIEGVVDTERVWTLPTGIVLAATFHEASDRGRLIRVGTSAHVILDLESEVRARRLSGPGDHDGDGRIHALDVTASAIWVATGVGVFEIVTEVGREADPGEG